MSGDSASAQRLLREHVKVTASAEEAVQGSHAIAVITEWKVRHA